MDVNSFESSIYSETILVLGWNSNCYNNIYEENDSASTVFVIQEAGAIQRGQLVLPVGDVLLMVGAAGQTG
jgi:hypothetical protein